MSLNLREEFSFGEELARRAGRLSLEYFRLKTLKVSEKSKNNPVSEADFAVNDLIVSEIQNRYPDDAILSEETSEALEKSNSGAGTSGRTWVIDPIDGTKEFVAGNPDFSISIGLLDNNRPVLGFIYSPVEEYLVSGGEAFNSQVFVNGTQIKTAEPEFSSLAAVNVCISKSELRKNLFDGLEKMTELDRSHALGSVAYKMALVAGGRFDILLSRKPKNEWDIAAGAALYRARGYKLYNMQGEMVEFQASNETVDGLIGGAFQAARLYADWAQVELR